MDQVDLYEMSAGQRILRHSEGTGTSRAAFSEAVFCRLEWIHIPSQDIDGKERVEIVRQVVVEKSKNGASERDHLLESLREKAVAKYIVHRCMRYFYDDAEKKYLLLRQGDRVL